MSLTQQRKKNENESRQNEEKKTLDRQRNILILI